MFFLTMLENKRVFLWQRTGTQLVEKKIARQSQQPTYLDRPDRVQIDDWVDITRPQQCSVSQEFLSLLGSYK
jgi:hypothetical protein